MRAKRLKKHPVEVKEARILRELKRQKAVGVLEDNIKPVIIQAPRAIPSRVSRKELKKLEGEVKEAMMKKAVEGGSATISFQQGKIFLKRYDGKIFVYKLTPSGMEKFLQLMKKMRTDTERDQLR